MNDYRAATRPTLYFIGVTTGQSSIMRVFPAWAEHLGLDAEIRGFDFPLGDLPEKYLEAVDFIRSDPLSRGALVTTHKLNVLKASRHLFDRLDPHAETLGEISCISKRDGTLIGHAKDPITSGAAIDAIVPAGHWRSSGGHLCILGAGGASRALTLCLQSRAESGDAPARIIMTEVDAAGLEETRELHRRVGFAIPIDYVQTQEPADADRVVAALPPGSMVINATGLGKDGPGSPLSDTVRFPDSGIVWEFNYRGELAFLAQAVAQKAAHNLTISDGWIYFIHGWTSVIAEVFDVAIPPAGPLIDELSDIARRVTAR